MSLVDFRKRFGTLWGHKPGVQIYKFRGTGAGCFLKVFGPTWPQAGGLAGCGAHTETLAVKHSVYEGTVLQ